MLTISFTGDVSFTGVFADPRWTTACVDQPILDSLKASDHLVANLEGPLTSARPDDSRRGIRLCSPPHQLKTLRDLGCTVLNLANNHILDCGMPGLQETLELARGSGLECHGAGMSFEEACEPLIVRAKGVSAALLAFSVDTGQGATAKHGGTCSGISPRSCREMIRKARKMADWVVVQYHGGEEYVPLPPPKLVRLLDRFAAWGADVVICHHAHVVQPYALCRGSAIFYGLGNFLFDIPIHRASQGTTDSAVVKLLFGETEFRFESLRTRIETDRAFIGVLPDAAIPRLDTKDYRYRYCRAVYNVHYWPGVERTVAGTPNPDVLRGLRAAAWKRLLSPARWRTNLMACLNPVQRSHMLAIAEYRLRHRLNPREQA